MDIQKIKLMGITADSKITQPNTAKDVSFRGEMGRDALGDGSIGRSLIKPSTTTPATPRIQVQFKDRVSPKAKWMNIIEPMIDKLIDKKMGPASHIQVPNFKGKINIIKAILSENSSILAKEDLQTVVDYLNSKGFNFEESIETYMTDKDQQDSITRWFTSSLENEYHELFVGYAINDIKDLLLKYDTPTKELKSLDLNKKIDFLATRFPLGEFTTISSIIKSAKSKEELIKYLNFDYSELTRRDLDNLTQNELGLGNEYNNYMFIKELLFCSEEEFQEKIDRLNSRPFLIEYAKEINKSQNPKQFFTTWIKLLNLPDAEYTKLTTPIQDRKEIKLSKAEYRKSMEEKLATPYEYNTDKALETTQKNDFWAKCFRDFRNKPTPETFFPFEEIPPTKKDKPPKLPTTREALDELFKNKKLSLDIKNRGGMNPTTETSEIKESDDERLGVVENAGIKIRYGAKTNWSNAKIARDIMQNFYDGNGHTLEGVKIDVEQEEDGSFKIKITGEGSYSYERLDSLGNSSKDGDSTNAGAFGEGTRIVAVNLLARPDTPYVKYACGDWAMTFGKSSDDLQTANMTQQLDKNEEPIKGNYIELKTKDYHLVKEILNSKNYFYSPYNEDFQDFNYENEFFGIKTLAPKERGNIYVIQRYETEQGIEDSIDGITLVFKKMPNDPELVEKNRGKTFELGTGRDRILLGDYQIEDLMERYAKTIPDKELLQLLVNLKDEWSLLGTKPNPATKALIREAINRKIGFTIPKEPTNKLEEILIKCRAVSGFPTSTEIDMLLNEGYIPVRSQMGALGIIRYGYEDQEKLNDTPTPEETKKIRLIDEGVAVLANNLEAETCDKITPRDISAATLILSSFGSNNVVAEAIIDRENHEFDGQWVKRSCFKLDPFAKMLTTKLHEITHKYGGDTTEIFTQKIIELEKAILKGLVLNPASLEKLQVLESMFDNTDAYVSDNKFNINAFKQDVVKLLSENGPIKKTSTAQTQTIEERSFLQKTISKIKQLLNLETAKERKERIEREHIEYLLKLKKDEDEREAARTFDLAGFAPKPTKIKERTIPTLDKALETLYATGKVSIKFPNKGGIKPTTKEKAKIRPEDKDKLGETKSARIKLRYGAKTNWSEFKIARDIMQNFYDGNGHTLEGVNIDVVKQENGKYKVKISGQGMYDYSHLETIGDSTKDGDANNAGAFGEGTRLVAVNMLANHGVENVTYGCGDWQMTFGKSSNDIQTGDMTQCLTQSEKTIKGNFIEFETSSDILVSEILGSQNSFYHPENIDFQDMIYENEFFGVKLLEDEKQKGHLYVIQSYETPDRTKDLNGISLVFKTNPNNPKLTDKRGKTLTLETGRDRIALTASQVKDMAYHYASTMSNEDLIKLLGSLEKYYQKDITKVHKHMITLSDRPIEESFVDGLIELILDRKLKLKGEKLKLAAVEHYFYPDDNRYKYLSEKGYKFVPRRMEYVGIKTVDEAYVSEHDTKSLEPTNAETQKIKLLTEGLKLFKELDTKKIIPTSWGTINIFDAKECELPNIHASLDDTSRYNKGIKNLCIDRNYMQNNDFITILTGLLSETQRPKGTDESSSFSYALTTLIESELTTLLHNPEIAQKLQVLSKMYDGIK